MADLIGSINRTVGSVASEIVNGVNYSVQSVHKGIIYVGEGSSRRLYDVYDLSHDGFEKLTKAIISYLKLATMVLKLNGLFAGVLGTLEAQKDLYYATKFIGSLTNFVDPKTLKFQWIQGDGFFEKLNKLLYVIGDCLEPFKALQKHQVCSFETCTKIATQIGNYRLSFWPNTRFEDIFVAGSLCDKPKEFFVFMASLLEIGRTLAINPYCEKDATKRWAPLADRDTQLKLVGSVGKLLLIGLSRAYYKTLGFALIDFATQNAGLVRHSITLSKKREQRFKEPKSVAAAAA